MITISCINTKTTKNYPFGTPIMEIAQKENVKLPYPILGALVNNKVRDLTYRLHKPSQIDFFDITSLYGNAMYCRSLYFLLFKAVKDILPEVKLRILHSISSGKYCALDGLNGEVTEEVVQGLESRMMELVKMDLPFKR